MEVGNLLHSWIGWILILLTSKSCWSFYMQKNPSKRKIVQNIGRRQTYPLTTHPSSEPPWPASVLPNSQAMRAPLILADFEAESVRKTWDWRYAKGNKRKLPMTAESTGLGDVASMVPAGAVAGRWDLMFKLRLMENGGNVACTRAVLQLIKTESQRLVTCMIDIFSQPGKSESRVHITHFSKCLEQPRAVGTARNLGCPHHNGAKEAILPKKHPMRQRQKLQLDCVRQLRNTSHIEETISSPKLLLQQASWWEWKCMGWATWRWPKEMNHSRNCSKHGSRIIPSFHQLHNYILPFYRCTLQWNVDLYTSIHPKFPPGPCLAGFASWHWTWPDDSSRCYVLRTYPFWHNEW